MVDELETAKILHQLRISKKRSNGSNEDKVTEPLDKQVISRKRRLSPNNNFLEIKRIPEANVSDNRRTFSDVPLSTALGNISSLNARPIGPPPQLRILHCLKPISSMMPIETSFSNPSKKQVVDSNLGNLNRNDLMVPFSRKILYHTWKDQPIGSGQFLAPKPFLTGNEYTKPTTNTRNYSQVFFPLCSQTGVSTETIALPSSKQIKICRMGDCDEPADKRKLYCSKHSGPRRCERDGCKKGAQGRTRFCIAHGGGRRCQVVGCVKGSRDGLFCALRKFISW